MDLVYFVKLINFNYYLDGIFDTLEDAVQKAKETGFECAIDSFDCEGNLIEYGIKIVKPF